MTNHPFDLKGIDTGKIGGNKYVDYTLEDFMSDQDLSRSGAVRALGQNKIRLSDLQPVNKPKNILDKVGMFLSGEKLNYQLPKVIKEALAKENEPKKEEKGSTDPLDQIDRIYKNQQEYERAMGGFNRTGRVLDNTLDFINMRMQMPSIISDLKDASTFKQQQLLDAEAIKQGLPNAQQARMLAASTGFANEAQAVAAQQDAATRFAGLGMQRRFG